MIEMKITRAEALLYMEFLNKYTKQMTQSMLDAIEEERNNEEVANAAKQNYVVNLESTVSRLEDELQSLKNKSVNQKAITVNAPWGLKKDGTPVAKPGRKPGQKKRKSKK